MPRLQILELPEGASDGRAPFVLVVDQYEPHRFAVGTGRDPWASRWQEAADRIGARGVIVTAETVEVPVPLPPFTESVEVQGDLDDVEAVEVDGRFDNDPEWRARQLEGKLKEFAESQYRDNLARMDAVTDALGFDRLRDWGEIVSAIKLQRRMDAEGGHLFGEPGFRDPLRCANCRLYHSEWVLRGTRCDAVRAENGGE